MNQTLFLFTFFLSFISYSSFCNIIYLFRQVREVEFYLRTLRFRLFLFKYFMVNILKLWWTSVVFKTNKSSLFLLLANDWTRLLSCRAVSHSPLSSDDVRLMLSSSTNCWCMAYFVLYVEKKLVLTQGIILSNCVLGLE